MSTSSSLCISTKSYSVIPWSRVTMCIISFHKIQPENTGYKLVLEVPRIEFIGNDVMRFMYL